MKKTPLQKISSQNYVCARRRLAFLVAFASLFLGCRNASQEDAHGHAHEAGDSWAVTAWGEHFEIFAQADPLAAGEVSSSHTHVTFLPDFTAVAEGTVTAVFARPNGAEYFKQDQVLRDGIFDISLAPTGAGTFELRFRVTANGVTEDIPAGRVRVGAHGQPGGLIDAAVGPDDKKADPEHTHDGSEVHEDEDSEESHQHGAQETPSTVVSFLKEQQWKTPFRTVWASEDEIHEVVSGAGRTRPIAGSEIVLTAPLDGEVVAPVWPYAGKTVEATDVVFRIAPRAGGHSLVELEAEEAEHRADLQVAKEQLRRLESLLKIEGASEAEVEAARAQVTALSAQHEAAKQNLRVARGSGSTGDIASHVNVVTPISGQIAEVFATPGEVVDAGETLARVVRADPFWVEVYLHPAKAAMLGKEAHGLLLRGAGMRDPVSFVHDPVRLVSRAPVVDEHTGRVACIFEVTGTDAQLPLGAAVEADVLLSTAKKGIVVPATAIVDDAGIAVVYIQVDGEGFVRREVRVVAREGRRLLVEGIEPHERVVTVGGAAIRRAGLVSSGAGHGHEH